MGSARGGVATRNGRIEDQREGRGRPARRTIVALGGCVALIAAASLAVASSAEAAPGNPDVPGPPTVVFEEDFENVSDPPEPGPPVVNGSYQFVSDYTGAGPLAMTYSADPTWISLGQCNGMVLSFNTDNPAGSCGAGGFNALRGLAQALGAFDPPPNGADFNHALSAWTLNQSVATSPAATLQTASDIPLSAANRFITFSVDVGVTSCGAPFDPLLRFFLVDGGAEVEVTDAAIDVCADPRGDPPPPAATRTGSFASDGSILTSASSVGFKLTNDQAQSNGNDYAYDNVRMLDATPQLDKEFVPATIELGQQATLRFTITNTDELAAKRGWSFTDTLAAGLRVASEQVDTDCPNATVDLELDGDTIDVAGDLDTGMESCTVDVRVTTTEPGTHENSEGNVSNLVGLDPPGEAELSCTEPDPQTGVIEGVFVNCDFSDAPPANDFTIAQDWESSAGTIAYQTPVVGDLYGTGDPVVVVGGNRNQTGGSPSGDRRAQDLHLYSGDDGSLIDTIETPYYSWSGHAAVALADVNGDGRGEIIFKVTGLNAGQPATVNGTPVQGRLIAYTYDQADDEWEVMWVSDNRYDYGQSRGGSALSVADFNGDGVPEAYVGNQIFNARTGARLAAATSTSSAGCGGNLGCFWGQSTAVDMDGDGQLELVAGNVVYKVAINNPNGEAGNTITSWRQASSGAGITDGFTGVADLDLDGLPDVVASGSGGALYAWDGQTDEILGTITGLGSVIGAPMLGDIDADGRPEIVIVTASRLRAYDYVPGSGLVQKWILNTNDGSGLTSMSMFDFNNDGAQEIVYRDQSQLRILDGSGATAVNHASFACASGTATEMPVIADIDGSGEARVLVTCNTAGGASVRAYESDSFPWANTRPVWNQQAYFVAHINDDLTVPANQFEHWTVFSDPDHRCSDGANRPLNNFQVQITDLDSETGCPVACVPPSLEIDKSSDPPSGTEVEPGDTVAYTIAIENTSSDDVPDVNVTDDLSNVLDDADVTSGPSVNPPGAGTAQISGDELAFNGTIPQGETVTITYEATVRPRAQLGDRNLGNAVLGDFSNCDGTTGLPRCRTEHPVVVPETDLELAKSGDAVVDPGDPVSYTLTVTNHGPDPSTGATVTDTLPGGLTNVQAQTPGCQVEGQTVTCEIGPLGVDDSTEIELTADAPNTPATCFDNEAAVEAGGDDPEPGNDDASFRTCTTPVADLVLTKETNPAVVDPDEQFEYLINVSNIGPNPSSGSVVTDTLPDGVTIVTLPGGCTAQGQTVTCEVGPLEPDQAQGFTILVEAPDTPSTCFENTASVEGDDADPAEGDPDLSNNEDTARTCTTPAADLEIEKSAPAEVDAGGAVTWTLTVTNHGPQASSASTVSDTIPSGITDVQVPQGCTIQAQTVTCEVGELDVDGSTEIEITGTAPSTGSTCFTNQASVEGEEGDPVLANNESDPVETCTRLADLGLEKSAAAVVDPGDPLTWTITVTNHGPDSSEDATVTDTIPAGITGIQVPQDCQLQGQTVTCDVGPLGPDQSTDIVITGDSPNTPATCFSNQASVEDSSDPSPSNDEDSVRTCTTPAADLELEKSAPAEVDPGGQVTWTLTVTNHGPQASSGSTVTDTIPSPITGLAAPGCDIQGQTVTCAVGPLDAEESTEIVITGDAPDEGDACFSNEASVEIDDEDPAEGDPDPSNNSAAAETCTNEGANLEIAKSADSGPHFAGDEIAYALAVTNLGPATAHDVEVTDDLPDSLTLVSATPEQGQCSQADPVECDLGTIGPDETVAIAIVATIAGDQSGEEIENTACAEGSVPDPADGNDCATETIDVDPEADLALTKTASPSPVRAGKRLVYTLEVTNHGPSPTPSATVTDTLPGKLRYESDSAGCDIASLPEITCTLGALGVGESRSFQIRAKVKRDAQGRVVNSAEVSGPVSDPNPDNSAARAPSRVRPLKPQLAVRKKASRDTAHPGQVLTYRITVRNKGQGVARRVRVCDRLPGGQRLLRVPGAKRTGSGACWTIARLGAGKKRTLRVVTQVATSAGPGVQRNRAIVNAKNAPRKANGANVRIKPAPDACAAWNVVISC